MSKPNEVPEWATDTNYSSGPDVGTATKVDPGAGVKAQGHVPGTRGAAQTMNWWKNLVGQWAAYVDSRFDADGEIVYVDGSGNPEPKERIEQCNLMIGTRDSGWTLLGGFAGPLGWMSTSASIWMHVPIVLPVGCELTRVEAMVNPESSIATTSDRIHMNIHKTDLDWTAFTSTISGANMIAFATDNGSSDNQVIDSGAFSYTFDDNDYVYARIRAAASGSAHYGMLYGLRITYKAPGPR